VHIGCSLRCKSLTVGSHSYAYISRAVTNATMCCWPSGVSTNAAMENSLRGTTQRLAMLPLRGGWGRCSCTRSSSAPVGTIGCLLKEGLIIVDREQVLVQSLRSSSSSKQAVGMPWHMYYS
jgi:hypothetical protein